MVSIRWQVAIVCLGAVALLATAGTADAGLSIGVNLAGYEGNAGTTLMTGSVDGVVPQVNWNNANGRWDQAPAPAGPLVDRDGNFTTVYMGAPVGFNFWWYDTGHAGNEPLLNGPRGGNGDLNLPITGIAYSSYDIIVYLNKSNGADLRTWVSSNPGTTYHFQPTVDALGFVQITNTDIALHPAGNYVVFSGLSGSTQTLNVAGEAGAGISDLMLSGFQIVEVVPEPATMCLLAVGAIGMLIKRRRTA